MFSGQLRTLGSIPFASIASLTNIHCPLLLSVPVENSLQLYMQYHLPPKSKLAFLSFEYNSIVKG
jgi:hypothetical protein